MNLGVFVGGAQLEQFAVAQGAQWLPGTDTPWGEASAPLLSIQGAHGQVLLLARHGPKRQLNPHAINYRANVWQMAEAGVDGILGTHTVGSIDPGLAVGDLVLPGQLIDYTWGRSSTFDDQRRHVEFSSPYSARIQDLVCTIDNAVVRGGNYGCTQGPRLETAAEIRRMAQDGCTLVGMTGMPEAALARELDIHYASLCLVVNPAAGVAGEVIDVAEMQRVSAAGAERIWSVIAGLL